MTEQLDSREALLDAVEQIISEKGSRDLSLREVARRAGVSHASPGHHFGDKEGMMAAFAERGFRMFIEAMTDSSGGMLNGELYVSFAREHKPYFDVMFRSGIDKSRHPDLEATSSVAKDALTKGVEEIQKSGFWADTPTDIVMLRLWSTVHGMASLLVDDQLDIEPHEVDEVVRAVLSDDGQLQHHQA